MTIEDQIRDEKQPYDINRKAEKISALSSGNIYTREYLTDEKILPSNQQQMIEQAKIYLFSIRKSFRELNKKN